MKNTKKRLSFLWKWKPLPVVKYCIQKFPIINKVYEAYLKGGQEEGMSEQLSVGSGFEVLFKFI